MFPKSFFDGTWSLNSINNASVKPNVALYRPKQDHVTLLIRVGKPVDCCPKFSTAGEMETASTIWGGLSYQLL